MKYIIECQETEHWFRDYVVEAKTRAEAIKKVKKGDWDESPYGECNTSEFEIISARRLEEGNDKHR